MSSSGKFRLGNASRDKNGFALLELLVCVAILAILITVAFVGTGSLSERSARAKCAGNLRSIGVATALYAGENNGWLPVARETYDVNGISTPTWGDSKSKTGAWYWNLAPYLDVPRRTSNKVHLGEQGTQGLSGPVVFTCPRHGQEEAHPITYPSYKPVSYAPTTQMRSPSPVATVDQNEIARVNLRQVSQPAAKVWIIDSDAPDIFNVSAYRWSEGGSAYETFQRHSNGGNALFLDGHIEYLPLSRITTGDIQTNIYRLFSPFYDR